MTTGGHAFLGDTEDISNQITAARYRRPRSIVGRAYPIELQVVLRKLLNKSRNEIDSLDVALDGLSLVISEKKNNNAKSFSHTCTRRIRKGTRHGWKYFHGPILL